MQDVLVQLDLESIQKKLKGRAEGRFCYYRDLNGMPEGTQEGQKILFSDGQEVRAESILLDVSEGEFRFEPLTPVKRPNPESPPSRGFTYVDSSECGKYEISFMGVEHSYKTFHKLLKGILKNIPESRNSLDELKYQIWIRAQDLDFSDREDFQDRIESGAINAVRDEIQIRNCIYPPTNPKELKKRFRRSSKANRYYSFDDFVKESSEFYKENNEKKNAQKLKDSFDFSRSDNSSEEARKIVKEKVAGRDFF